jgi:iron complex transport system permease protein
MGRSAAPGLVIACAVLVAGLALAFTVGRYPIDLADVATLLLSELTGTSGDLPPAVESVILQVRGPRVLAAVLVGAALAVAGTAFQGLFRNPLVSPDILGASSGAALGAVLGIYFSLGVFGIQGLAFAGGLLAVAAVYALGSVIRARDPILVLVLTGVVIGSLLGAGVGLVKYLADPYNQLPAITFWLLGSFAGVLPGDLAATLVPIAIGLVPLALLRWRLDVLSLSEDEARSLGVDVGRVRLVVIVSATLVTASAVALAGTIGWVGLVIPHATRMLVGAPFARVLPLCLVLGAGFMLAVDTLCRNAFATEIPPGVVTAFIGTPVFIALLAASFRRPA